MANIFNLAEVSYESLFDLTGIPENDRTRLIAKQSDIDKFNAGIKAILANFANLGLHSDKQALRKSPHFLSHNFLRNKGLDCSGLRQHQHWFCSFDLYNRSDPKDPNGPRRIIAVCENAESPPGKYFSTTAGGKIMHMLYTNNHYGDGGKTPAFSYVNRPMVKAPKIVALAL